MSTDHDTPDSAEITLPQDDLATRKNLGPYELKRKLGQGGMGAVYLAVDPALKRQVALKILPREKASNPQLVKRFKAEAQNASQLTHENIVSVYGAGEADGYLYIALEFIDGIDVHDLVERRGVLPVKRSIDIIKQVCRALQHALEQGIVHRDIKPANLLVRRDGVVKLADMGLARAVDESTETGITRAGTTVGTVDYMSPEQARNSKSADVRSDMYSLGCTWFHMLTGAPPFAEGSLTNKLNAHANRTPPDARDKNEAVPEGVVAVMQRMMAKDPDDRYQTPLELIRDLEGALVNKDAVSRKILEALNDDSAHGDEDDLETGAGSESDPYPVNMQWSDSGLPVQAGPVTAVDQLDDTHFEPQTAARPPSDVSKPVHTPHKPQKSQKSTPAPHPADEPAWEASSANETSATKGTAPSTNPATSQTSNATPARGSSTRSARSKPAAAPEARSESTTSRSKPAATPDYSGGRPQATANKPAAVQNKPSFFSFSLFGGKSKPVVSEGRSKPATLPPPKRKGDEESLPAQVASPMPSQVKMALTALGILLGLGAIVFLASLAQRLGDAAAPLVAPVQQALPPPPVQAGNEQQPGEAVATADGANPTVKDILNERNELLEGKGDAGKSAGGNGASAGIGEAKIVPDWVDASLPGNSIPLLTVRRGPTAVADRQFGSLVEALKNIPVKGARIVLAHDGPFDLTPVEFSGCIVIIEAGQGTRPQIRLVADGEHRKLPWLNLTDALLALDGIDIVGDAGAVPSSDPWTWVRVTDGHLYVRRSSFTLIGKRSAPTIALKQSGGLHERAGGNARGAVGPDIEYFEARRPRFLVDQSVIRGESLQCIQLESPDFEGVIRNSLIVAGDATAVVIRGAEKGPPKATRQLRLLTSTVCSSQQALSLSAHGTANPNQTDLILKEALFAAPAEAHLPVLLSLEDWPVSTSSGGGPYKNLSWKAEASAILGFHPLLKLNTDEAKNVADGPAWKKLWKEQSPTTFSTLPWPTEMKSGILATPLKAWSPKTLESLALAFPVAGVTPGCPVSGLRAPEYSTDATTASAQPQRPRPPAPFAARSLVPVDLIKTDLGKLIGSKDWEDGTVFVASGSGQRYSSPIVVDRHKWRIQFQQTEGATLVISPRGAARSGSDNSAFITIRGGQLDLEQGTFNFDAKDASSVTPWFVYAEGGGFRLHKCRIAIPSVVANR
ncbi:MAG: pknB 33, partial [Planctomycetaceae bacterium]|nr:pknB 33 [Planctomycetaceae bacterium]